MQTNVNISSSVVGVSFDNPSRVASDHLEWVAAAAHRRGASPCGWIRLQWSLADQLQVVLVAGHGGKEEARTGRPTWLVAPEVDRGGGGRSGGCSSHLLLLSYGRLAGLRAPLLAAGDSRREVAAERLVRQVMIQMLLVVVVVGLDGKTVAVRVRMEALGARRGRLCQVAGLAARWAVVPAAWWLLRRPLVVDHQRSAPN